MKLIIILLCFAVEKTLGSGSAWRRYDWLIECQNRLKNKVVTVNLRIGLVLSLVIGMTFIVQVLLDEIWGGVLGFVFALLVLWYCLGPENLEDDLEYFLAGCTIGALKTERAEPILESTSTDNDTYRAVTKALFWQSHERLFAVLFWFCLLGPTGAMLYRTVTVYKKQADEQEKQTLDLLHGVVAWLPARLTALSYSLAGDFLSSYRVIQRLALCSGHSQELLSESGCNAIRTEEESSGSAEENRTALELTKRAFIVWLMVVALVTISINMY